MADKISQGMASAGIAGRARQAGGSLQQFDMGARRAVQRRCSRGVRWGARLRGTSREGCSSAQQAAPHSTPSGEAQCDRGGTYLPCCAVGGRSRHGPTASAASHAKQRLLVQGLDDGTVGVHLALPILQTGRVGKQFICAQLCRTMHRWLGSTSHSCKRSVAAQQRIHTKAAAAGCRFLGLCASTVRVAALTTPQQASAAGNQQLTIASTHTPWCLGRQVQLLPQPALHHPEQASLCLKLILTY